jgi:putative transposase
MARALSDDLGMRVLKASTDGLSARQAAARCGVGVSTAIRWVARSRTGERTARPQGRRRGSSLDAHEAFIVGLIEERQDITLHETAARLLAEHTVSIRRSALSAWLRGRGWTFKKVRPCAGEGAARCPEAAPRLVRGPARTRSGTVRKSMCGRRVEHQAAMALVKRSPKMTAN